jgi:hypothetical protein
LFGQLQQKNLPLVLKLIPLELLAGVKDAGLFEILD